MPQESSAWLHFDERAFPDGEWREHLRAFNIKWARTRHTQEVPIWYAIEGKGFVVWVSQARLAPGGWRIILAVLSSAPAEATRVIAAVVDSALRRWPGMRLEKPFGKDHAASVAG